MGVITVDARVPSDRKHRLPRRSVAAVKRRSAVAFDAFVAATALCGGSVKYGMQIHHVSRAMTKAATFMIAPNNPRTIPRRLGTGVQRRGVPAHRAGRLAVIGPTVLLFSTRAKGRPACRAVITAIIGPIVASSRPETASMRAETMCVHVMDDSSRAFHSFFRLGPRRQQNLLKVVKVLL
eukprot:scaffold86223_cov62-Phaeocystis_antarctica.AAC.6